MRITLDIDDDVLQAAKALAKRARGTVGQVISALARRGLRYRDVEATKPPKFRNGIPVLPSRGEIITLEHVEQITHHE